MSIAVKVWKNCHGAGCATRGGKEPGCDGMTQGGDRQPCEECKEITTFDACFSLPHALTPARGQSKRGGDRRRAKMARAHPVVS